VFCECDLGWKDVREVMENIAPFTERSSGIGRGIAGLMFKALAGGAVVTAAPVASKAGVLTVPPGSPLPGQRIAAASP